MFMFMDVPKPLEGLPATSRSLWELALAAPHWLIAEISCTESRDSLVDENPGAAGIGRVAAGNQGGMSASQVRMHARRPFGPNYLWHFCSQNKYPRHQRPIRWP